MLGQDLILKQRPHWCVWGYCCLLLLPSKLWSSCALYHYNSVRILVFSCLLFIKQAWMQISFCTKCVAWQTSVLQDLSCNPILYFILWQCFFPFWCFHVDFVFYSSCCFITFILALNVYVCNLWTSIFCVQMKLGETNHYFNNVFLMKQVDVAILEVGLGGKFDATNVVCTNAIEFRYWFSSKKYHDFVI